MKQSLLLLTGLQLASTTQAQIGFRAGANYALFSSEKYMPDRSVRVGGRFGYQVGVFYEQKLSDRLSLVPEAQFSRQRVDLNISKFIPVSEGYYASYDLKLAYLNVPVLLRIRFGSFYLEGGPQASFLLAAREQGTEEFISSLSSYRGPEGSTSFDRSATTHYRRFDAALYAGAGVKLPAGFGLGVRSYISPFTNAKDGYYGVRNQTAQASVSYQFGAAHQ